MLAMDIPMAVMTGFVFAEAGAKQLKENNQEKNLFIRIYVAMFMAIFFAPNAVYYTLGWPAWEVNYLWSWVDGIHDNPLRAGFSHALIFLSVVPALLGLEGGRYLILRGKEKLVRASYIVFAVITLLAIAYFWKETMNVASTYAQWIAGDVHSFMTVPMLTGWAITAAYYWIALFVSYAWLKKRANQ